MHVPDWLKVIKNPHLSGHRRIPVYAPIFGGNEKAYLADCIDSGWISPKGNYVTEFENAFAEYVGAKYAIACSSGTAALHLAIMVLGMKQSDEVIVPTLTMASTAFVVSYAGATPVFIDSEEQTGNLNPDQIESLITPRTKAIIPVHLYGTPCNLDAVGRVAKTHHIEVIEDAAESIGAQYRNRRIGSISRLSAFSLYVNKVVTAGQGGMITTSDAILEKKIRRLNNYYFSPIRHFWHQKVGYNFKLSNLQAAVGLAQIEKIDILMEKKQTLAGWYRKDLDYIKDRIVPLTVPDSVKSNNWMIAYRMTDPKVHAQPLRQYLGTKGIETRSFFIPMHLQPAFRKFATKTLPVSEMLCRTGFLLPSGPGLSRDDVAYITRTVIQYLSRTKNG